MRPYNLFTIIKAISILGILAAGIVQGICQADCTDTCADSFFQIGATYTRAHIKVDSQSAFCGNLGGIEGIYEYKPMNNVYGGLKVDWKEGKTKNSFADRCLTYVDAQERLGYTFTSCDQIWSATLFSGFGYRHLRHKLKQNEESIKFNYNEFYIPLGFLTEYSFLCYWSLGLNVTWMPQIYPTVQIQPLKGARWVLKNTIGNVSIETPLTYRFSENPCYFLVLKPFYERWKDGRSTAKTSNGQELGLPKNSYTLWGVALNFAFLF
jgi:hypothetical protein